MKPLRLFLHYFIFQFILINSLVSQSGQIDSSFGTNGFTLFSETGKDWQAAGLSLAGSNPDRPVIIGTQIQGSSLRYAGYQSYF